MIRAAAWGAAAALLLGAAGAAQDKQRPNVLWITVDDMNRDSVGVYGCPIPGITPNIDRLAAQGMRFEHAHVTIAICQPTRAVWMTGRYPHNNGALGFDKIRPDVPTLVERVHEAGWFTGLFSKSHHVVPSRAAAFDVIVKSKDLQSGRNPERYHDEAREFFMAAHKVGKPFFLMANANDPHRPFAGSAQEKNRRKKRPKSMPKVTDVYAPQAVPVPGFLPDLPAVRREMAEYFTSVHRADATVGALLRALEGMKLADDTIVMFMSDHGMPLPFAKTNCYRHSTITPWIVRWPGEVTKKSVDREHMVSGIDLTPTLLEALGLPPLDDMDGRSFMPLLRGGTQQGRDTVFTMINKTSAKRAYPMRAIQDRRFGYIYNGWADGEMVFKNESQNGRTFRAMKKAAANDPAIAARVALFVHRVPEELYDYERDPDALRNLADDPQHRERLTRMRALLMAEMRASDDPELARFQVYLKGK